MLRAALGLAVMTAVAASPAQQSDSSARETSGARGGYTGAVESEHPHWFKESFLDLEQDIADAAATGKRLMLYFWQHGCPYCNVLIEQNFKDPDIGVEVRRLFDVVAINMWGDREVIQVGGQSFTEKTLAEALRVSFTPTLLFFDEDRNVVLRLNGYYPPPSFRLALEYASAGQERDGSFHDFLAARQATEPGQLRSEPFFSEPPYGVDRSAGPGDRPLAVYFEQGRCPPCDALHDKVLSDKTTRALAQQFESIQLDMWSDTPVTIPDGRRTTARDWAAELGVSFAPTIVLFDRSGREVMRIESFLKTFHTQSVFDYVLSEAYVEQPNFQRYLSARADRLRDQGVDVDIFGY
jgi:thioredoxin-related protein